MSKLKSISTKNAPSAIGAYSQAVQAGNFIFISGQIPLDPSTMEVVSDLFGTNPNPGLPMTVLCNILTPSSIIEHSIKTPAPIKTLLPIEQLKEILTLSPIKVLSPIITPSFITEYAPIITFLPSFAVL